jgi:hypothetical protein
MVVREFLVPFSQEKNDRVAMVVPRFQLVPLVRWTTGPATQLRADDQPSRHVAIVRRASGSRELEGIVPFREQ